MHGLESFLSLNTKLSSYTYYKGKSKGKFKGRINIYVLAIGNKERKERYLFLLLKRKNRICNNKEFICLSLHIPFLSNNILKILRHAWEAFEYTSHEFVYMILLLFHDN